MYRNASIMTASKARQSKRPAAIRLGKQLHCRRSSSSMKSQSRGTRQPRENLTCIPGSHNDKEIIYSIESGRRVRNGFIILRLPSSVPLIYWESVTEAFFWSSGWTLRSKYNLAIAIRVWCKAALSWREMGVWDLTSWSFENWISPLSGFFPLYSLNVNGCGGAG